jgi:hypothetical protein
MRIDARFEKQHTRAEAPAFATASALWDMDLLVMILRDRQRFV